MSEWIEKRLGEMIEVNPKSISASTYNGTIQYIDISSVESGRLLGYTKYDFVDAPGRARRIIKPGDTIISTVRPNLRGYLYVKECPNNVIASTGFAVLRTKEGNDKRFIYYLVTENSFIDYLSLVAKGSNYPAVDTNDFKQAKVTVPSLPTQTRIAEILSAYDDAIENNNHRIALLEKAARELYREWFVRMRFPGYKNMKFVNCLPEGWGVKKLGDIVKVGRGSSPRPITDAKYFANGNIPWIKIADATKSTKFILETNEYVNEYGASFSRKLPIGSMIIAASGTLGFPMFLGVEGCIHDGWMYFFEITEISKEYLYFVLLSMGRYYNSISYGAAIQNINTEIVRKSKIIMPEQNILKRFSDITSNIDNEIKCLLKKSQNLARQRDLLLPRLMSGKLEV